VIAAGYALSKIDPETRYRHMVEEDKIKAQREAKDKELTLRERELDEVKVPAGEAKIALSQAQAAAAEAKAAAAKAGDGKASHEERLRWTTLFSEAGRRLSDANKALSTLQRDPVFMAKANKQGSPEAQQMQELRNDVETYKQDRATYSGLLSSSQAPAGDASPASAPASPASPASPGTPRTVSPRTQAARDGEAGAILLSEYGGDVDKARADLANAKAELARTKNPDARGILQGHVNRLEAGINAASNASPAGKKAGASRDNPVAVSSRGERDKLPKGAFYKAPDGQVYIKQ
jgi:hypothetical protein